MGGILGLDVALLLDIARKDFEMSPGFDFYERLKTFEREAVRLFGEKAEGKGCDAKKKARCKAQHGKWLKWACENCEHNQKEERR